MTTRTADVLDRAALRALVAELGDQAIVGRLVDLFLTEADSRVRAIARALDAGDDEIVTALAQGLKGSAATVGATAIAHAAAALERRGAAGELDALRVACAQTRAAFGLTAHG